MKIAIVTSHPVPFALGGAENLWWGLQQHFNTRTEHRCDIVSLISPEAKFWELVDSYEAFARLDLSNYDCVITGKYPAWMVNHPNHICYMLHRLRGLYDTYGGPAADDPSMRTSRVAEIVGWMAMVSSDGQQPDSAAISELFDRLRQLREVGGPETEITFPGPFSRAVVRFLDNAALAPQRIRRYAAIAGTVAARPGYFPPGVMPDVVYPPPHRDDYFAGSSDYFFTSSRLDGPKRVDLIIKAMDQVEADIPLLIAGTGADGDKLKALASKDARVKFLGFVPDEQMPALYANALAVPFVPFDEDYGLVTIEAMRSATPVATVTDAGGPCEFVEDGVTGTLCAPNAVALGERMNWLAAHPNVARELGAAAQARVADISRENVATALLADVPVSNGHVIRPKLTVATTFRSYPPRNGGQARVFQLYRNLAASFDIDLVSLGDSTELPSEQQIAPGLIQRVVPRSIEQVEREHELTRLANRIPLDDIAAHALAGLTPEFGEALALSALTSQAVIASHPYLIETIIAAAPKKPIWYEAHNVELTVKSAALRLAPPQVSAALMEEVRQAERTCWLKADRVFACAQRDLDELQNLYGPTRARLHEVPNGTAIDEIPFTEPDKRRELFASSNARRPLGVFMGSWHGPNLEAVEQILCEAGSVPELDFIVIGSVCRPFSDRSIPPNVALLGQVDDTTRNDLLAIADLALNPMTTGSGTNLKMLDYFAAGVPVVSTLFGARGLLAQPDIHFMPAADTRMETAIRSLLEMRTSAKDHMVWTARHLVVEHYSWAAIAERFGAEILQIPDLQSGS